MRDETNWAIHHVPGVLFGMSLFLHLCCLAFPSQRASLRFPSCGLLRLEWNIHQLVLRAFCSFPHLGMTLLLWVRLSRGGGRASYFRSIMSLCAKEARQDEVTMRSLFPLHLLLFFWRPSPTSPFTQVCFASLERFMIVRLNTNKRRKYANAS